MYSSLLAVLTVLLAYLCKFVAPFSLFIHQSSFARKRLSLQPFRGPLLLMMASDETPSDMSLDAPSDSGTGMVGEENALDESLSKLISLVQNSNRGRIEENEYSIRSLIEQIESVPQSISVEDKASLLEGKWDLLWCNDDITRASPFFWAFKKATRDLKDPVGIIGPEKLSESIFKITDSIPFKTIGKCSQTFKGNKLISQVEVDIGLPSVASIDSSKMTTTSQWQFDDSDSNIIELRVEKTQVLDSTLEKLVPFSLPLLGQSSSFPSGQALEALKPGSSTVYMRLSLLNENYRICRNDEDDKIFVFEKSLWE